jgi:ferredoxin
VVRKNGETSEFECPPDATILDAAEEAGVDDLPYSCRAGACAACAGKISRGTVDQGDQAFLTEQQKKEGYCLTCVSYPTSDVVLETHVEAEVLV